MICYECKQKELKSEVHELDSITTCMYVNRFYDSDGNYHVHDPNASATYYRCSNGHRFTSQEIHRNCPVSVCNWGVS